MAHQKVKAPKAVKAWAIENPEGKIICVSMFKAVAWAEANELTTESEYFLKRDGFKCVPVQILPLTK